MLGTNPLAIAVPSSRGPIVLDIGTSAYMMTDVMLRERLSELLPEGVAIGPDGEPTRDPTLAPMAATMALEMIGPMPGTLISRSHPASCRAKTAISPDN